MLQKLVDIFTYSFLKLNPESKIGSGINFFLYDVIKIMLLLVLMITVIGFFRTYISQEKLKKWAEGKGILGNLVASLFGAVTPFCSCSSIPIFIGFLESGMPLGIAFSFLITSPIINEYLVVLMLGFFGIKITSLYVLSGVTIGVVAGSILGRLKLERFLMKDLVATETEVCKCIVDKNIKYRFMFGLKEATSIIKKLWIWIFIGVGIGATIHNYVPQEAIQSIIKKTGIFTVPIATILGVPMYGNCAAIIPIAVALFRKGIPLGTALAFMMATAALSIPEAAILKRTMKLKLILIFFGITTVAIIFTGYLFNLIQSIL